MLATFTADTRNEKHNLAWLFSRVIQLFTWMLISKEAREYFGLKDSYDCPTHCYNYVEQTKDGEWIIFEAAMLSKLNYEYFPRRKFALLDNHIPFHSVAINKKIASDLKDTPYGFMQLFNHIRIWLWWKVGKDVRGKKAWFVKNDVCSEYSYTSIRNEAQNVGSKETLRMLYGFNQNNVSPATLLDTFYYSIKAGEMIEEH